MRNQETTDFSEIDEDYTKISHYFTNLFLIGNT